MAPLLVSEHSNKMSGTEDSTVQNNTTSILVLHKPTTNFLRCCHRIKQIINTYCCILALYVESSSIQPLSIVVYIHNILHYNLW